MGKLSFENQGTATYLVYDIDEGESIDTLTLGMITNNKIKGLAPSLFTQLDSKKIIKYNVTSKVAMKQFFEGVVRRKQFLGVLRSILDALIISEEYMIQSSSLCFDIKYIFVNVSSCEAELICLPVMSGSQVNIAGFVKEILFSMEFAQNENCDFVTRIITYLNGRQNVDIVDFRRLVEELYNGAGAVPVNQPAANPVSAANSAPAANPVPEAPVKPAANVNIVQNQRPVQNQGNAVPRPQVNIPANNVKPQQVKKADNAEKKMSAMYLITHYSKENKEKYKAQRSGADVPVNNSPKKAANNNGFAIPGQAAAPVKPAAPVRSVPNEAAKQSYVLKPVNSVKEAGLNNTSANKQESAVNAAPVMNPVQANNLETTVLKPASTSPETTVLGAGSVMPKPYLIRMSNNDRRVIDKAVFKIGKERSYVDYCISDNNAISRSHANIVTKNNEYYVIDTNSTNNTYVNGSIISSNVEVKIENGTRLRFANEDFEFRIF